MIYTYFFTNKFFEDLRSNINSEQILDIIDFLRINLQTKENIYYCGSENIFDRNFGINGKNSQLLDHFISKFYQTCAISNFSNKENKADMIFCGNNENITKNILKIDCNKILNENLSLTKIIEIKTEDEWINDDGKEDLNKKLTQLLKFTKSIIFIDRHVPACVADNNPIQLKQWRLSLQYFNSLILKYNKINTIFINGVNNKVFDKYKSIVERKPPEDIIELIKKSQILKKIKDEDKKNKKLFSKDSELNDCEAKIELKGQEFLKSDLKKFFSPLNDIKTYVMIKDKEAWREIHDRYIFFFLEEFDIGKHTLEEFVRDKNLIIFEVSEGLNILDVKSKTTSNRKIIRQKNKVCSKISIKWDKKVSKLGHFYKFTANEEKKAS
jgi:hypothetical protein